MTAGSPPRSREVEVELANRHGLHLRPATRFAQIAMKFRAEVTVVVDGQEVNGKSILMLTSLAAERGARLKVILETALLSDGEKVVACELARLAGADFVKTSTGFGGGGASVADVALLRRSVGPTMGIKASGGVRDAEFARALLAAGATRLGTSASVALVSGPG